MENRLRAREYDFIAPGLPAGPLNSITDVDGVAVGQVTLHDDSRTPPVHTGVTVIIPHPGDVFNQKLVAAVHTINGYGKAAGFEQVREMGTLETPIALTNTLCVGRAWDGLVSWMLARNPEIGTSGPSVNPVVGECNDSRLNDLRGRHVRPEHVLLALERAGTGPVEEGTVGAGTGMICYGYKGGVGTASRRVEEYTLGALLVANFGRREQLTIRGVQVAQLVETPRSGAEPSPGSVMIVLATDAPLTARQLGRIARRAVLGLARTGSIVSSGSGDFVIAFSTGQKIPAAPKAPLLHLDFLPESALDGFFQAAAEAVEEAVLNALCRAVPVQGPGGFSVPALPAEEIRAALQRMGQMREVGD
ncbi:MAG: P1 family peptidase [Chloroflexi bacterium]|nr:P1 family peptidase [Chloroflexota bacterium]